MTRKEKIDRPIDDENGIDGWIDKYMTDKIIAALTFCYTKSYANLLLKNY